MNLSQYLTLDRSPYVLVRCRTVRIGSYKAVPVEPVIVCPAGIRMRVPHPREMATPCAKKIVEIDIDYSAVKKLLAHFSRSMPVLFLYTSTKIGEGIRKRLGMEDVSKEPYYHPLSSNETHKRITLLPEKLSDETREIIRTIFDTVDNKMVELDTREANAILVRASPRENQNQTANFVQPQQQQLQQQLQQQVILKPKIPTRDLLVYPPPPMKGGISINTDDYICLGEDNFLNDVIIDFYLKYLMQCKLSEKDHQRTHVFSSYFYKRLTTRTLARKFDDNRGIKLSAAEQRHARVKSWTKNVNIFEKDFIIIPINENSHWFLAIICFPGLKGPVRLSDGIPISVQAKIELSCLKGAKVLDENTIQFGCTTITMADAKVCPGSENAAKPQPVLTVLDGEGSDRDEAEGDDDELVNGEEEEEGKEKVEQEGKSPSSSTSQDTPEAVTKAPCETQSNSQELESVLVNASQGSGTSPEDKAANKDSQLCTETLANTTVNSNPRPNALSNTTKVLTKTPFRCHAIKQSCILIFDSLACPGRARVVATLRDYLRIEHKLKMGQEREFNKDDIRGACPKVPQQNNYTDCGIYLLQYVESFFENPIQDFSLPIRTLQNWFPVEVVQGKRECIGQLIQQLMSEQNIKDIAAKLPEVVFPSANKVDERVDENQLVTGESAGESDANNDSAQQQEQSTSNPTGIDTQSAIKPEEFGSIDATVIEKRDNEDLNEPLSKKVCTSTR